MSSHHLRNISVSQFESFLELVHCMDITHNGGHHQKWTRSDLTRQIIFQKKNSAGCVIQPLKVFKLN